MTSDISAVFSSALFNKEILVQQPESQKETNVPKTKRF